MHEVFEKPMATKSEKSSAAPSPAPSTGSGKDEKVNNSTVDASKPKELTTTEKEAVAPATGDVEKQEKDDKDEQKEVRRRFMYIETCARVGGKKTVTIITAVFYFTVQKKSFLY